MRKPVTAAEALCNAMAKRHPSAAGFGGWPMGSIAWRGTFSELQDIIAKCLATKKFPAKPLAGNSAWRATSLRMPRVITKALQSRSDLEKADRQTAGRLGLQ